MKKAAASLLLAVVAACGGGTSRTHTARRVEHPTPTLVERTLPTTTTTPPATASTTPPTTAPPPPTTPLPAEARLTRAKADQINQHYFTKYQEVVVIIGGPGTEVSQYTESGNCGAGSLGIPNPPYTCGLNTIQIYQWPADTDTGYAYIQFVNGQKHGPVTGH